MELRNLTVLPLLLSQERDDGLLQLTEGRIPVFSHDMVPDYLRTKPEPAAEARMLQHEQKANNLLAETAVKQAGQFTKVISHIYEMVNKAREEYEGDSSTRSNVPQTSSLADTHALVLAIGLGKGLATAPAGMMVPPATRTTAATATTAAGAAAAGGATTKAPSAIKTNIKSANQVHPYARP